MVAAGAVVTKDVSPYTLVAGSPARSRGWVCQCGQKMHFQDEVATCNTCGLSYTKYGKLGELNGYVLLCTSE